MPVAAVRILRGPLGSLILAAALFFLLDSIIFRSGLYARIMSPDTTAGKFFHTVLYERYRASDPARDVLLLGNSKMEFAFSVKTFEEKFPASPIHLVLGAVAGSTEQWWFYMLRYLDPGRDRYAAVVIPISNYQIGPWREDFQGRFDTAQVIAPILSASQWPSFLKTYSLYPEIQTRAALLALLSSHVYALDVQDLLLRPKRRLDALKRRKRAGSRWLFDYEGISGDVEELRLDHGTGQIVRYPATFTEFKKRETNYQFERAAPEEALRLSERNAAFEANWLKQIVAHYGGSRTKLIFIQMPRWPIPLPESEPLPAAPDIRTLVGSAANLVITDPGEFTFLESPHYFADMLHLNTEGRRLFTERLGADLMRDLPIDN